MVNPASIPVPDALAARARLLLDGKLSPVPARPASTVVLLRDSDLGLQVYVIRRHRTMAFAAGMYAFPGGRVDPQDGLVPDESMAGSPDGFPDGTLSPGAFELAAVRELFEETSVLLAGPSPTTLVEDTTGEDFEAERHALVGRALSFKDFLARRSLVIRSDLLAFCGHWITPAAEERRFDTKFYFAAMPSGQVTQDVSSEADRVAWLRPADIEAAVHAGEMRMLPPTAATIALLAPFGSVAEAFAAVRSWEIPTITPEVGFDDAGEAQWRLS